jgi:ATP-dependent RNA helicase MSS116
MSSFTTNNSIAQARAAAQARANQLSSSSSQSRPRGPSDIGANNGEAKKKKRRKKKKKNGNNNNNNNNNNNYNNYPQTTQPTMSASSSSVKVESRTTSTTLNALSDSPFSALQVIPELKRSMAEVFQYQNMTKVQEQSIPVSLTGMDILAKAKTGTGKTIAFLIPALHKIQTTTTVQSRRGNVSVLVISPTRELASQIEQEALGLTKFLPQLTVQCVYGGTNVQTDLSRFKRSQFPDILVATPGRLNDHLENHGLGQACSALKCLIFDEADQLLEMGFRPAITKMLQMLPPKHTRQTTLFSATMPNDVMGIARFALGTKFEYVDCVGKDDQGTHQRVPQFCTVYDAQVQFEEIAEVLTEGMREPNFKIIIFFVTARLTGLHAELFKAMGFPVVEIHSRKSQSARTKASKEFRDHHNRVLFTSDVSARGMDYPDVSMVVQVGLPDTKAQYVHRLGRTARAGKTGIGVLMLAQYESFFLTKECRDQPMKQRPQVTQQSSPWTMKTQAALRSLPSKTTITAYQAWLGFYNGKQKKLGWNARELVRQANLFATNNCMLAEPPALMAKTVGKMGLRGTPGLRVEGKNGVPRSDNSNNNGGGRGGGGRGGGGRGGNNNNNNRGRGGNINNNGGQMTSSSSGGLNWQQQQMMNSNQGGGGGQGQRSQQGRQQSQQGGGRTGYRSHPNGNRSGY